MAAYGRALVGAAGALAGVLATPLAGLNVPPQQGTTNAGCFLPGIYDYQYTEQNIADIRPHGFNGLRLPINIDTALDEASVKKLKDYVNAIGGGAVLCMFGTQHEGDDPDSSHGTSRVDDVDATMNAWRRIHQEFADFPDVHYEIFNEPAGYSDVNLYMKDMMDIIDGAELPKDRCIIAGAGWSSDVKAVVDAGWDGDVAYHVYPNWLSPGQQTQEQFSNLIQESLKGISNRVWITEFGAALNLPVDYEAYDPNPNSANVNALRGLHDAVIAFRDAGVPLRGVFHWHGWHNGDSYDFWASGNANGAEKVRRIMSDVAPLDVGVVV